MTPTNQVRDLIDTATKLVAMLERESGLLRQANPREIGGLQEDKANLTTLLEAGLSALRANPTVVKIVAPTMREELSTAIVHFQQVAAANERAVRAARQANERLLIAISDAVAGQASSPAYGKNGKRSAPSKHGSLPALAVNARL
jgi:flagellar biosynthesis/type III secretory pathway chaperone